MIAEAPNPQISEQNPSGVVLKLGSGFRPWKYHRHPYKKDPKRDQN